MDGQQGQTLRTNVKRITKYIIDKITDMGFDVYITFSHTSKSRYLEFHVGNWRSFIIRISDHPTFRQWKYDYDVFTEKPRRGSVNYLVLIQILEHRLFREKTTKTIKDYKRGLNSV
jgi:hypothetical protein